MAYEEGSRSFVLDSEHSDSSVWELPEYAHLGKWTVDWKIHNRVEVID